MAMITMTKTGRIEWTIKADGTHVATAYSSGSDRVSSRGLRSCTWTVQMVGGGTFTAKTREQAGEMVARRIAKAA